MQIIAKNQLSTLLSIYIKEGLTIQISANNQIDLLSKTTLSDLGGSDIPFHLDQGNIIINNGMTDLSKLDALKLIYGNALQEVQIPQLQKSSESKLNVQNTARPIIKGKSFQTVWTGKADDIAGDNIGTGIEMVHNNVVGASGDFIEKDYKFLTTKGDKYIHQANFLYENAGSGDYFHASIYSEATPLQTLTNLDLEIAGIVIKPAVGGVGTGTHGFDIGVRNPTLVKSPDSTGFWDYDGVSINANPKGTGAYNLYTIEIEVYKMMNHIPVFGTTNGFLTMLSYDSELLPNNYFIRVKTINVSNTIWTLRFFITMFRESTI